MLLMAPSVEKAGFSHVVYPRCENNFPASSRGCNLGVMEIISNSLFSITSRADFRKKQEF